MVQWITDNLDTILWSLGGLVVGMVLSMVIVAVVIAKLPVDYFEHDKRPKAEKGGANARRIAGQVLGWTIVLTGLVMLVLPGPGVVVLLIGIFLVDFPGKYKLQKKLVSRPGIFSGLNKMRKRFGKPPFVQPESKDDDEGEESSKSGGKTGGESEAGTSAHASSTHGSAARPATQA